MSLDFFVSFYPENYVNYQDIISIPIHDHNSLREIAGLDPRTIQLLLDIEEYFLGKLQGFYKTIPLKLEYEKDVSGSELREGLIQVWIDENYKEFSNSDVAHGYLTEFIEYCDDFNLNHPVLDHLHYTTFDIQDTNLYWIA